ncbi:MAG: hypothetical protein U5K37_12815 [Natrialbaceae archaeon]|nr:hypothetical protein [Natrialbaceae archaeon]
MEGHLQAVDDVAGGLQGGCLAAGNRLEGRHEFLRSIDRLECRGEGRLGPGHERGDCLREDRTAGRTAGIRVGDQRRLPAGLLETIPVVVEGRGRLGPPALRSRCRRSTPHELRSQTACPASSQAFPLVEALE